MKYTIRIIILVSMMLIILFEVYLIGKKNDIHSIGLYLHQL